MNNFDIIECRWLLTMNNDKLLENQAVVIENNKIISFGNIEDISKNFNNPKNRYKLDSHILMPGLINAHTHSPMVFLRSLADEVNLQDWLTNSIWPAEKNLMGTEYIYDGMQLAIYEMILNGTTCINEHYFLTNTIAKACNDFGMRAKIGVFFGDINSKWADFDESISMLSSLKNHDLVSYAYAPHSPYLLNDKQLSILAAHYQTNPLTIHIHCNETKFEVDESINKHNKTPIERLDSFGLVNQDTCLVHMIHSSDSDLDIVKQQNASIISCPKSNSKLASGILHTTKVLSKNINLGIGTDSAASNNQLSILDDARLMALNSKIIANSPKALSAYQCLYAATMGNAKALGMQDLIGSITPGKYADMIAINLNKLNTFPQHNPISQILYSATAEQITHCWINGKLRMQNRVLLDVKEKDLLKISQKYQAKTADFCIY
jgi:5-methylthioadenosine/S-adenosylhomocysteine deaminase